MLCCIERDRLSGAQSVRPEWRNSDALTGPFAARGAQDLRPSDVSAQAVRLDATVPPDDVDIDHLRLDQLRGMHEWQATSYRIESDEPILAGVDGEALEFDSPLDLHIRPKGLRVLVPASIEPRPVPLGKGHCCVVGSGASSKAPVMRRPRSRPPNATVPLGEKSSLGRSTTSTALCCTAFVLAAMTAPAGRGATSWVVTRETSGRSR